MMRTKEDLTEAVRSRAMIKRSEAEDAVRVMFEAIEDALARTDGVVIREFGRFESFERKARVGRNPRTGEAVSIPACYTVRFHPAPNLRARIQRVKENAK